MTLCLVCAGQIQEVSSSCATCGFLQSRVSAQTGEDYPADGSSQIYQIEDRSFWFRHRHSVISEFFEQSDCTGPILDVGGGNGYETLRLQEQVSSVCLIEPSPEGCRNASERGVRQIVCSNLENLRLKSGSIGTILLLDVIEHFDDPQPLLRECLRILRPGGVLLITVPAYGFLWSHEDIYARHKRRYNIRSLSNTIQLAGYEIERISGFFQSLILPIFLFRALRWRLGFGNPARTNEQDHQKNGIFLTVLEKLLASERQKIARGSNLFWGASLISVARKNPREEPAG